MNTAKVAPVVVILLLGAVAYTLSHFAANSILTPGFFALTATKPLEVAALNCTNCSQTTFFGKYHVSAERLEALYEVLEQGSSTLAFDKGRVTLNGQALRPGCHQLSLTPGDELKVRAGAVSFDFPAKSSVCSPDKPV